MTRTPKTTTAQQKTAASKDLAKQMTAEQLTAEQLKAEQLKQANAEFADAANRQQQEEPDASQLQSAQPPQQEEAASQPPAAAAPQEQEDAAHVFDQQPQEQRPVVRQRQQQFDPFAEATDYERLTLGNLALMVLNDPNEYKAKREIQNRLFQEHRQANETRQKRLTSGGYQFDYLRHISICWLKLARAGKEIVDNAKTLRAKLLAHPVFNQPVMECFSSLDLIEIMNGRPSGEKGKVYIRGLEAISALFPETYLTVSLGPVAHSLNWKGKQILINATTLNHILASLVPNTRQAAPFTTRCVLKKDLERSTSESSFTLDGFTMLIQAGTTFTDLSGETTYTFEEMVRVSVPYEVYVWNVEPMRAASGVQYATPELNERFRQMAKANQALCDTNGKMRRPETDEELQWLKVIVRYDTVGDDIFAAGRMAATMNINHINHFDLFAPAWQKLQKEREQARQARWENNRRPAPAPATQSRVEQSSIPLDPFADGGQEYL